MQLVKDTHIKSRTMLNRIIQYSLDNRILIIFFSLILLAGGLFTVREMEVVFPLAHAPWPGHFSAKADFGRGPIWARGRVSMGPIEGLAHFGLGPI